MSFTKPITTGFPNLKLVRKNERIDLNLLEKFEYLYSDSFTLQVGETYVTEAKNSTFDTALFIWSGDNLIANGKNEISYTNETGGPIELQLTINQWSDTSSAGQPLEIGVYSMWKGDSSYSDGRPAGTGSAGGSGSGSGGSGSGSGGKGGGSGGSGGWGSGSGGSGSGSGGSGSGSGSGSAGGSGSGSGSGSGGE